MSRDKKHNKGRMTVRSQVYEEIIIENDVEYQGTIKIIRMWTHYDNIK